MTDEEKSRELTRSSFAAQMAMLGYEPNGNPKDMVEVIRCKDCKYLIDHRGFMDDGYCKKMLEDYNAKLKPEKGWFCADGKRKEGR